MGGAMGMPAGWRFAEPGWLLLAGLALLPWLWERRRGGLSWPGVGELAKVPGLRPSRWRRLPLVARSLALAALAVALARPQSVAGELRRESSGVAVVVALDVSTSMATERMGDAETTRLDAARDVFTRFVLGRPDDLLGLVRFANYPDTACGPTLDHQFLLEMAAGLKPARATEAGTNIGDAIAWASRDALGTGARRHVVVVVTDGRNEPGVAAALEPTEAARLAGALGVVVHVVAIGEDPTGNDARLLEELAHAGNGRLFTTNDTNGLSSVFGEIDRMERGRMASVEHTRYREWHPEAVATALGLVMLEAGLRLGRWRRWP